MADTSVSYKCPCCGAPLTFIPGQEKVTCEYCGTQYDVKTIEALFAQQEQMAAKAAEAAEAKWKTAEAGSDWSEEEAAVLQSFTCSSCGAEIVADANTMATECCYCGNPTMMPQRFSGMLKPDYIIPFEKTKDEAVAALQAFYKGKRLLPDAFTKDNRVQQIQGLYVPFWLFDSDADAAASFKATLVNTIENDSERIIETSYYDCHRCGNAQFERIPADGSTKMDDTFMESIEPFDYSGLQPFTQVYLTGHLADKYDVDAETSAERADNRVNTSMVAALEDTVLGYDTCEVVDSSVTKTGGNVTYAMVPIWILTTQYEGKPYTFMMNGQTGKFAGSLPIDKKKLQLYSVATFLIAFLVVFGITWFVT